jgi:flagellar hook assembly protein FlgD
VGEIVPGSVGLGKPPGVVEVRYRLGQEADVRVELEGLASGSSLLHAERQVAGEHVLRFNGVISATNAVASADGYRVAREVVPPGDYSIKVTANGSSASVGVRVGGTATQPPSIANMVLRPETISPNSDAIDDVSELTFRTGQTATLSVDLVGPDGAHIPVQAPIKKGPGEQNVVVGGEDLLGERLPDGSYTVTLRVRDEQGSVVLAERPLRVEGSGEPAIAVLSVDISPEQLMLGDTVNVTITVKNVSNVALRTQGPDPGYTYTTRDSYASIEGGKWDNKAGLWRVGVDWDANTGGAPYRYPFRWGFGKTLMPGETAVTGGKIQVLKEERTMWFYAGVLQEGIRIALDKLGRTKVEVGF